MNAFMDPGIQLLTCSSVELSHWGPGGFRAPYWRLYHNDRKGAVVRFQGRVTPLDPARIYLIAPETDFSAELRAPVRHFFIHFTARPPYERVAPGVFGMAADAGMRGLIAAIEAEVVEPDPARVASSTLRALALVHLALLRLPAEALTFRPADERIERAVSAIDSGGRVPCSNPGLAALAHMTPNAFIRRFHEIMGESPQQYARRKRIEQACVLLHFSGDSVDQIAEATGFCDRYHFSRVFKQVRGMGPAEFRKAAARLRAIREEVFVRNGDHIRS